VRPPLAYKEHRQHPTKGPPMKLSQQEYETVMAVVTKVIDERLKGSPRGRFKIYPPQEVKDDPSLLSKPNLAETLADTVWRLRFWDGSERNVSFTQLMTITHNVIIQTRELAEMDAKLREAKSGPSRFHLRMKVNISEIMEDATVKELLASLQIEGVPT